MMSRIVFIAALLSYSCCVVFGCQRGSFELLAFEDDVVTLSCDYDKLLDGQWPTWFIIDGMGQGKTITNGSDVMVENKGKYNITDDRNNMTYDLKVTPDSVHPNDFAVCALGNDGNIANHIPYYGYTVTVFPKPNCSMEAKRNRRGKRSKKINLRCSWDSSALSKQNPLSVSWVQINHPGLVNENTIMDAQVLKRRTNSQSVGYKLTLSPEHYGDVFACVARTETSNNTLIGCSYVPLTSPDVTITQIKDSITGESVLFTCNATGFLTDDFVFSWIIDGVDVMELDDDHFKLISSDLLKIDKLKLIDNGLDIMCLVKEDNVTFSAQVYATDKETDTHNQLENEYYITVI